MQERSGQEQAPKIERPQRSEQAPEAPPVSSGATPLAEVPVQPRSLINAWHNRPGRVIE